MSFPEIETTAPKRQRPPRQFTLAGLLRLFVAVGLICATAVWLDVTSALALGVTTCVVFVPRWAFPTSRWAGCMIVGTAAAFVWLTVLWLPSSTGVVVLLPSAIFLARARFVCLASFVLLTPLGVSFGQGVYDYWRGEAVLRTEGYALHGPATLDRQTRCYYFQSYDCAIDGREWAFHDVYNQGVRAMTTLFGYMRGAYTGPYPTQAEAAAALADATPISWDDLVQGRVELQDSVVRLDETVRKWLEREYDARRKLGMAVTEPVVVVWNDKCLLVRVSETTHTDVVMLGFDLVVTRDMGRSIKTFYDRPMPFE